MYIDSTEIKHPNGYHSDQLGFTFKWNGHFLRGIYRESADLARLYFESGFISELCRKGMFPNTWISSFENEEFAFIIEHEVMEPLLYATEWNFSMLRDAAVLVLQVAKIAKKYGFNMVDCHKLNVMFRCGKPVYVDLGSFIPNKEGSTAWIPYLSFMRSYVYILDIWNCGAGQIAKRSMTPGVEFCPKDYYLFRNPCWRLAPRVIDYWYNLFIALHGFAAIDYQSLFVKLNGRSDVFKRAVLLLKRIVNVTKPLVSQRQRSLDRLTKRIKRMSIGSATLVENDEFNSSIIEILKEHFIGDSITLFDVNSSSLLSSIVYEIGIEKIISIHENEKLSDTIYECTKKSSLPITSSYYQLSEGGLLIRERFPEDRLKSCLVVVCNYNPKDGIRGVLSTQLFVKERLKYSSNNRMLLVIPGERPDIVLNLQNDYNVIVIPVLNRFSCFVISCR